MHSDDRPDPGFVEVGWVRAPHGVEGELWIGISTDHPHRLSPRATVYLRGQPYCIQRAIRRGGSTVVKLEGVDSLQEANQLRGLLVEVPEAAVPPTPEGEYYYFQLMDMAVYTVDGEYLGALTDILNTGANDVYVIRHGEKEVLVPAVEEVVVHVDVAAKRMTVDLPEGLR